MVDWRYTLKEKQDPRLRTPGQTRRKCPGSKTPKDNWHREGWARDEVDRVE